VCVCVCEECRQVFSRRVTSIPSRYKLSREVNKHLDVSHSLTTLHVIKEEAASYAPHHTWFKTIYILGCKIFFSR